MSKSGQLKRKTAKQSATEDVYRNKPLSLRFEDSKTQEYYEKYYHYLTSSKSYYDRLDEDMARFYGFKFVDGKYVKLEEIE